MNAIRVDRISALLQQERTRTSPCVCLAASRGARRSTRPRSRRCTVSHCPQSATRQSTGGQRDFALGEEARFRVTSSDSSSGGCCCRGKRQAAISRFSVAGNFRARLTNERRRGLGPSRVVRRRVISAGTFSSRKSRKRSIAAARARPRLLAAVPAMILDEGAPAKFAARITRLSRLLHPPWIASRV